MDKAEVIAKIELMKKEIRLAAQKGISDHERDEHLTNALRQASFAIATIEAIPAFDRAFNGEASMGA